MDIKINCNFTKAGDLRPILSLPQSTLDALAEECQIICLLTYGTGNPDLAGVGVVISYAMGLVLAMLFGPLLFLDFHLLPTLRSNYRPTLFSSWLQSHQHTSLWSQLFFSFTVSLACCVRQYQESCAFYEASTITQVVGISIIGISLALSSFYHRIERLAVFVLFFLSTLALGMTAVLAPMSTLRKFNALTQACEKLSINQPLPWNKDLLDRYDKNDNFPELFSDVALILGLNAIWCYLWIRRKHWLQGEDKCVRGRRRWINLTITSLVFLISIPLLKVAWTCFNFILFRRNVLSKAWQQNVDENAWGIGQIGATFVWAPLLIEMSCSALWIVLQQRKAEQGKKHHNSSSETNVAKMQNLEEDQLLPLQVVIDSNAGNSTRELSEHDKCGKQPLSLDPTRLPQGVNLPSLASGPVPSSLNRRNTG